MENLRLYVSTYNVGTHSPDEDLRPLLGLSQSKGGNSSLPDLYALSFQEVKAQPQNMLMDALFDDPWTYGCKLLLEQFDYVKLKSIRLQGLLLNVYCLRKHLLNVRDIESEYTRTGLSGMWVCKLECCSKSRCGNKGAVSVRLSLYGCSLCFVNAHLSAHDNHLKDRINDYNIIVKDQEFHVEETTRILFHDYVFWMGDLNFRLMEELEQTPEEIEQKIVKKEYRDLLEWDQLKQVMKNGEAFSELVEKDPDFPPTFKFEEGTDRYNLKRRPAWCDRILHSVATDNYENVKLSVKQLSYRHHPTYRLSDHKPVTAEFVIKIPSKGEPPQVFSDYAERVIEFDKIHSWNQDEENKAKYRIKKAITPTTEDWIGLFKENFSSLDEYITYEYVSKCTTPTEDSRSCSKSDAVQKYELEFSELPGRCTGKYRLVYFSQTEDKVVSVLGISNAFPIVKDDSE